MTSPARPAWAVRGSPYVLSSSHPSAPDAINDHARRMGRRVVEVVTVPESSGDVVFARCEPVWTQALRTGVTPEEAPPAATPDITYELSELTDRVIAVRVIKARERRLSLTGKMAALTESAHEFHQSTEAVLDGIAEKIALAKMRRDVAAEKHHGFYDEIIKGVEDSVTVIDRLSNGPLAPGGEG